MNSLRKTVLVTVAFFLTITNSFSQSNLFKAGKNLDIQYSILRELSASYVDTLNFEKLINTGINAMLRSLDPYTEFLPEDQEENIEMMTTARYGGVGSVIKKIETGEIIVSQPYKNSPSSKMGLQPGDTIIAVNGENTLNLTVSQCSEKMRGEAGTDVTLSIKKVRTGEIKEITIRRDRIHVSDVVYSGIIQDTVGYIMIGGFTQGGAEDLKKAIIELRQNEKVKMVILDYRGNGGGLMEEAINTVSLFVPEGTLVVSSKGRSPYLNEEYHTAGAPAEPDLPLMIMVNSGSASSTEIVAGALQDLDRAVIAGARTHGKGLIQTIRGVGYNTNLKLTTGKYYTPSGRCVQAIDYSNRNEDGSVGYIPDSLRKEFHTVGGRPVYDGGGIDPDLKIASEFFTRPIVSLVYNDILNDYALKYYSENKSISSPRTFEMTDTQYEDFVKFAAARTFDQRSVAEIEFDSVIKSAKQEGYYDDNKEALEAVKKGLTLDKPTFLRTKKDIIKPLLEQEIVTKYYFEEGGVEYSLRYDKQLLEALKQYSSFTL